MALLYKNMGKSNKFYSVVDKEFGQYRNRLKEVLIGDKSEKSLEFVNYLLKSEGKGVRPLLVLLSAALNGQVNENSIEAAVVVELTHTASLVHDDIVDEAYQRRGQFSVNALWRSRSSVLIGDYILAKAISTAIKKKLYYVVENMSMVIEEMSKGELEQSQATLKLDINEERYFNVIRCKTAYLMSAASTLGAMSVGADEKRCEDMKMLGELFGLLFQIKDDILDYSGKNIGKSIGNDLKEKKITLPLIYALKKSSERERKTILSIIRKGGDKSEYIKQVQEFIINNGGIVAANTRMEQIKTKAKDILLNNYPDTPNRVALLDLMDYIVSREK